MAIFIIMDITLLKHLECMKELLVSHVCNLLI